MLKAKYDLLIRNGREGLDASSREILSGVEARPARMWVSIGFLLMMQ